MKKTNLLFIIWGVLVIGIVICLTILGFILKNRDDKYKEAENKLKALVIDYITTNDLLSESTEELTISVDDLLKNEYLKEFKVDNDVCTGYVLVKLEEGYNYFPYINCNKYITKGYKN